MEERPTTEFLEEEINLGKYFAVLRRQWRKIALLSLAVAIAGFLVTLAMPNIYQASAVIGPPSHDKRDNPAMGMLATFGVNLGGATKIEDLESIFKSNDLAVRVFGKHNLWPILYKDRYDSTTGKIRKSWVPRFFGGKGSEPPGEWDAIRASRCRLKVIINRREGTLSISFESPSPEGSAEIVRYYLDEGKSRLQEEALARATWNKKFIEEQIGKTLDVLTRDRLYSLFSQEVEQEMMARNREQFGFRVIDSPRVPDRKSGPHRGMISLTVALIAIVVFSIYFGKGRRNQMAAEAGNKKREEWS